MAALRLCMALIVLALVGCALASGSTRADVENAPSANQAVLVAYRPYNFVGAAMSSTLIVDRRQVGVVKLNGAWSVTLQPGSHDVMIESGLGGQQASTTIQIDGGAVGYVRIGPAWAGLAVDAVGESEAKANLSRLVLEGSVDFSAESIASSSPSPPAPPDAAPVLPATGPTTEKPRMLVMAMRGPAFDLTTHETMTQLLVTYLSASKRFLVLSSGDLKRLMDLSAERQKMDCDTEQCLAEIGSAFGARYVAYSRASKLGNIFLINVTLFDVERAVPIAREVAQAPSLAAMPDALAAAAARLIAMSPS